MEAVKRAHVRGLLHAFKVLTQSILQTQVQANEQASKYRLPLWLVTDLCFPLMLPYSMSFGFTEAANRTPGKIEDLCDLLAEDWVHLGSVHEMGDATQKFFRAEIEKSWVEKHLCVFSDEEAKKWVLGVSPSSPSWLHSKAIRFEATSWSTSTPLLHLFPFFLGRSPVMSVGQPGG